MQPALMVRAGTASNRLRFLATVNLEGATIADGELALGDWGEGFVDRRHPHTYVHELILTLDDALGRVDGPARVSLAAGKGFAPFGTDDPMSRPIIRYPVNHHLSQILERAVAILGIKAGPVMLEGGLFNGDEPERPSQWPKISRFGDSWSARLSLEPATGLEVQGSHARVASPEHREGAGTDQSKWSLSGRWFRDVGGRPVYGLVEWARTSEADGFFVFESVLAEGAWTLGRSRLHYRFERTDRPEEERTLSPFRSRRPHFENSILGQTRWNIHTVGLSYGFAYSPAHLEVWPVVELSLGTMRDTGIGIFRADAFYGKTSFWTLNLGARIMVGMPVHRMGRYGVAEEMAGPTGGDQHAAEHHH